MGVILKRLAQIGVIIQTVAGTEETLTAADFSGKRKEADYSLNVDKYERGLMKAAFTVDPSLKGSRSGGISFTEECVGGGAAAEAPWHRSIQAAGFSKTAIKYVTLTTPSGPGFAPGDLVGDQATYAASTKTGMVVAVISSTRIVYKPIAGTFAGSDTFRNYATSSSTGTVSGSPAAAGYIFEPTTPTEASEGVICTVENRNGGMRRTYTDAKAKLTVTMNRNEPVLLKFDFMGVPVLDSGNGNRWREASAITNIPAVGTVPTLCKGTKCTITQGATLAVPVSTKFEVQVDNTLGMRQTTASNDIQNSGFVGCRITDRKITVTIDPEMNKGSAGIDWVAALNNGGTMALLHQAGLSTDANGLFVAYVPAAQIDSEPNESDRDGIVNISPTLLATGNADDEVWFAHVFA